MSSKLEKYRRTEIPVDAVWKELSAQFPSVTSMIVTRGYKVEKGAEMPVSEAGPGEVIAVLKSSSPLSQEQLGTIERWLRVRLASENVKVVVE